MGKKFIIISMVFMLLLSVFTFNNSVYASNEDNFYSMVQKGYSIISSNGYDPKKFTNYFILENGATIVFLPDDSEFYVYDWSGYMCRGSNFFVIDYDINTFEPKDNNWINMDGKAIDIARLSRVTHSTFDMKKDDVVVFNKNIDFFYQTPAELATVLTLEEGKQAIMEIVEILPLILVVVVSFLGLRKALSWLLILLRRS